MPLFYFVTLLLVGVFDCYFVDLWILGCLGLIFRLFCLDFLLVCIVVLLALLYRFVKVDLLDCLLFIWFVFD